MITRPGGITIMVPTLRRLTCLACLLFAFQALASQVGWTQIELPGAAPGSPVTTVALYYPTKDASRPVAMGPFTPVVAFHGDPVPGFKALILVSHGLSGSELGHSRLAEALAAQGYLVAALRHPGDNWQDNSLLTKTPERYFFERPRQVSRVIDALLADPVWKGRIPRDAQGLRIGAFGHSAGGYTVIALAGGEPDPARVLRHCREEGAEDPIYCRTGRSVLSPAPPSDSLPLRDPRVRAVVALAPVGVIFSAKSLAEIKIPVAVYGPEKDRWLVSRFHAEWIAQNLPGVEFHRVPNAWHFVFMDTPSMAIQTPDGDIAANPPGFDRAAFLKQLGTEMTLFFDRTFK